jgi:hypothetical protein
MKSKFEGINNQLFPTILLGINHQMRDNIKMKNEPNYITENRNSEIVIRKSLTIHYAQNANFSKKIQKKHAFCKLLTLTHLTPYTTKTYITFRQGIRFPALSKIEGTLQKIRKYAKRTQFNQRATSPEKRATNYAKRTQFE